MEKNSTEIKTCAKCENQSLDVTGLRKLKKIDFIWVNREYESFEWFVNLLAELKIQQSLANQKFIDIHLYWTNKNCENSIAMQKFSSFISSMSNNQLKQTIEELFNGINKGRPNFSEVFQITPIYT